MFVTDYKSDIINRITAMHTEFSQATSELSSTTGYLKNKLEALSPEVQEVRTQCRLVVEKCEKTEKQVEDFVQ